MASTLMEAGLKRTHEKEPHTCRQGAKRTRLLRRTPSSEDGRHRKLEERLVATEELKVEEIPEMLALFADRSLVWGDSNRRLRSAALLITYITRGSRPICEGFAAADGLVLLGEVMCDAVACLENACVGDVQEDASMHALACLRCLKHHTLLLTQASEETAITASLARLQALREHSSSEAISDLCKRAADLCRRLQSKVSPCSPDASDCLRRKAVVLIAQGFLGTAEAEARAVAEKVEVALMSLHGGATPKYRQHARMLKSNLALAGNAELRARLLCGLLTAEELVAMESPALAPEALQEERRLAEEKVLRLSLIPNIVVGPMGADVSSLIPDIVGTVEDTASAPFKISASHQKRTLSRAASLGGA